MELFAEETPASASDSHQLFQPQDYQHVLDDFEHLSVVGWEFVVMAEGFKVFRRVRHDNPNLFEYKSIGIIPNVSPDIVYRVYMDAELRKRYDSNQGQITIQDLPVDVPKVPDNATTTITTTTTTYTTTPRQPPVLKRQSLEWVVKYPWPLRSRLYVFQRETKQFLLERGAPTGTVPSYVVLCRSAVNQSPSASAAALHNPPVMVDLPKKESALSSFFSRSSPAPSPTAAHRSPSSPASSSPTTTGNHIVLDTYEQHWLFSSVPAQHPLWDELVLLNTTPTTTTETATERSEKGDISTSAPFAVSPTTNSSQLQEGRRSGTAVLLYYFDDPKGGIPKTVVTWAMQHGVPAFVKSLSDACAHFVKEQQQQLSVGLDGNSTKSDVHAQGRETTVKVAPL